MGRKQRTNRRKPATGNRSRLLLVVVLISLCGALFLLEWLKTTAEETTAPPPQVMRHKMPARQSYVHPEFQPYTSAHVIDHKAVRRKKPVSPGTIAIVIDDMGSSIHEATSLMSIGVPLTFSIIPGLQKARDVARLAHDRGYQVMMHIPMEPQGYPAQRLEANGLLLSQGSEEIARRVNGYFTQVPYADGANNHMGSKFSEDREKMAVVLNQLKARGLFYIDSMTTPQSVGLKLARSMEVDSAGRNVFLDNEKEVQAITSQLDQLAALARKKGSAIGICHPHQITIKALSAHLPRLKKEGITFVSAGELVR